MRRSLALLLALLLVPTVGSAQKRPVEAEDVYRLVSVGSPALSPMGELLAFTVTTVNEQDNRRHRVIWLQRLLNGEPVGGPFRFTDASRESTGPRWSPDGALLSFTSQRGQDGSAVHFMRVTAPGGEAFRIRGVEAQPHWSPDGAWIASVREPRPGQEARSGETSRSREGWIAPDAITRTLDPRRFDGRVITHMRYKWDGVFSLLPHPSSNRKAQLWLVPAEGGEARQLTALPFNVAAPKWSPDGRLIFFVGDPLENDEYERLVGDYRARDLWVIGRDGGEPRRLTNRSGDHTDPAISPSGRQLAFLRFRGRGTQTQLFVADLAADGTFRGEPHLLAAVADDWDGNRAAPYWTPDGRALRFTAGVSGDTHLFEVAAVGGPVRQVTSGERRLGSFSSTRDGRFMAYTGTDPVTPAEIYVGGADGRGERQITSFNRAWLAEVQLAPAERLTWRVADGSEIEGWLLKPLGFRSGGSSPLVLSIHGGPRDAYGNSFSQGFQMLAGAGFFVLYLNPRGSINYGHEFANATRGQWGEMDQEDFLTGIEAAIRRYGEIDRGRLGVTGSSYGGFAANWLSARTDIFAAVVSRSSISNLESWYGSGDLQGVMEYEFMGTPWEQRELYRRLSPISYVDHVNAPTLIIHGENDFRTPIAEAEAWYMSLKKRRVPVELVRYPRSAHGIDEPWLQADSMERTRSWFVHWLIHRPADASVR